ncbi:MAG: isoprenylcysteine carboxylmethyltransferase family protein [Dehalococcoidia bacterium]|nr:isoprenylcysteine carboxylmethyltransferase family protein [Dehalococcoidia bacterium]
MSDSATQNSDKQGTGLNRLGIRGILVQSILIVIGLIVLFISAGTLAWINAWIYVGLVSIYQVISTVVLARVNPQLLNERGTVTKAGTKTFDKVWIAIFPVFTFGNLVIMGFDAVRYQWSVMPFWLTFVGILMFVSVAPVALWAMAVNKFFEWTVRIQNDRGQYVCTSGPYGTIRHPGYAGLIMSLLAYPFILGSWWGFLPNLVLSLIIVIRTALEDRTLQKELPGYAEYAQKVKYRLIPLIW